MLNTVHVWTLLPMASGVVILREPTLMSEYSTPMPPPIDSPACLPAIASLKKRAYKQRVRDVEHAFFTPLVLPATGGMANDGLDFSLGTTYVTLGLT